MADNLQQWHGGLVDPTLTKETVAADAKSTGVAIEAVKKTLKELQDTGVSSEYIEEAIREYLTNNPIEGVTNRELDEAVEAALQEAKDSGEFDGPVGPAGKDGKDGNDGERGEKGVTFTPSVSEDGTLSWTNDGGLTNPNPVNIMGPAGANGEGAGTVTAVTANGKKYEPDQTGNVDLGDIGGGTADSVAWEDVTGKPDKLPNPNPLTINGKSYDGSEPVDVTISSGSGEGGAQYINELLPDPNEESVDEENVVLPVKADDSAKLGGKAPEYYTNPRNLLDNSYWKKTKEIVNQRGQTAYTDASATIDRWGLATNRDGAYCAIDLTQGEYLFLNSSDGGAIYFYQRFPKGVLDSSKNYTVAWKTSTGEIVVQNSGKYGMSFSDEYDQVVLSLTAPSMIEWCALYEGIYTADNLPPYVPKGYAAELLACNIVETGRVHDSAKLGGKAPEYYIQPRNLLDNSNFCIAQAGYSGLHDNTKYAVDRWTFAGTSVEKLSETGGIRVSGSQWNAKVRQFIPNPTSYIGKTLTFAARMRSSNLAQGYIAIFPMKENGAYVEGYTTFYPVLTSEWKTFVVKCTIPAGTEKIAVAFDNPVAGSSASNSYDIDWAALYEGTYTAETLPPYVPKGYAVELTECQRYYRHKLRVVCGKDIGALDRQYVYLSPPMRINNPTATLAQKSGDSLTSISLFAEKEYVDVQTTGWGTAWINVSADL